MQYISSSLNYKIINAELGTIEKDSHGLLGKFEKENLRAEKILNKFLNLDFKTVLIYNIRILFAYTFKCFSILFIRVGVVAIETTILCLLISTGIISSKGLGVYVENIISSFKYFTNLNSKSLQG